MNISWKLIQPNLVEISWPKSISEEILHEQISLRNALIEQNQLIIYEIRMGYHVLSILFAKDINSLELDSIIKIAEKSTSRLPYQSIKKWIVPVCYDPNLAKDLNEFCRNKKIELKQLIQIHTSKEYLVHFYGFLPGFMYLGGLDERLYLPRKHKPDAAIPAGAVGIGGEQTGIYPMQSPGGWHIIGRSPLKFFNIKTNPPVVPAQGDFISFESVSISSYEKIAKDILLGKYIWENE
ncbi:allophanate hydrolase subunit 1 [Belliella sp. DSM 111904]|uniref:Allophanate hydrolase subunit 1 n=1 Tax=Belliella filtrata TaxID=2923435 RepID=A0ABS9V3A0_9BACT|nr:allophanate hydrolase subunit 1 [Belliella filtrata]MCH7410887.1 allophanate hydrolase subunit 1 [Belliella filtrata]